MSDTPDWGNPGPASGGGSRGRGRGFMNKFSANHVNGFDKLNLNDNNGESNGASNGASDAWGTSDGWGGSTNTSSFDQPRNSGPRTSGGRGCFKCGEEGHMSRECPSGGGGGGARSTACFKCNQEGHQSRDCPSGGGPRSTACFKCNQEGHQSRDCPSGGGSRSTACFKCNQEGHQSRDCPSGGGPRSTACFKCNEEGHLSRDCPNPGSGNRSDNRACRKCGSEGHMARDCPEGGGDSKPRGCFRCGQEGHMSKDCTEPPKAGPDGKPREIYIPEDYSQNVDALFESGISSGINFNRFQDLTAKVTGRDPPQQISRFEEAGLRDLIMRNVSRAHYTTPTPIQKAAIPIIMAKRDLMACAQTGSGKTAAFLVPIIHNLLADGVTKESGPSQSPQAVIVAPTRELAIQICSEATKFAYNSVLGICIAYGGAQRRYQQEKISNGCNILVATTGRLKDFVDNGIISFTNLKYFVLDEADRMLDMGFMPDIKSFIDHPTMPYKNMRQTLMFSATFPDEIQHMAAEYLEDYLFVAVGVIGCASTDVRQAFESVSQYEKKDKLVSCLRDIGGQRTLVFVESKVTADFLAAYLSDTGFPTTSIHGDRLQSQREEALRDFKSGKRTILVATAVAARGLDIKGVEHVINYDLPQTIDEYVHRIGRTGRVGNTGNAMSFYDPDKDSALAGPLLQILAGAQQDVPDFIQNAAQGGYSAGGGHRSFSRDVRRPRGGGRGGRDRFEDGGGAGWGGNDGSGETGSGWGGNGGSQGPVLAVEADESWD